MGICFWGTSNFLFSNVTTTRDNNNIEICLKRIHYITLISLLQLDPLPINQTDSGTAHTKIFCHHLTRMGGSKLSFLLRNKQCLCCSSQCYYVNRGLDVPSSLFLNISSVFLTKKGFVMVFETHIHSCGSVLCLQHKRLWVHTRNDKMYTFLVMQCKLL